MAAEPLHLLPAVADAKTAAPPWRFWWLVIIVLSAAGWAAAIFAIGLLVHLFLA